MEKVEFLILRSLLYNEEFLRKTLPFLKKNTLKTSIRELYLKRLLLLQSNTMNPLQRKHSLLRFRNDLTSMILYIKRSVI